MTIEGNFPNIEHITIGNYAFKSVNRFIIIGRYFAKTLTIGDYAFTRHKLNYKELSNREFIIQQCSFERIQIGSISFVDFSNIVLSEIYNLKELIIGKKYQDSANFFYAKNMHGVDWDHVYEKYKVLVGFTVQ